MYSTFERLTEKTGKNKPGRLEYLKKLVEEFFAPNVTKEMKYQLVANLANFAYDPINYGFFRELSILNIFLDLLADDDYLLVRFSVSGLCNLSLDPENKEYILASGGVSAVSKCLYSYDEETLLSSISALMFLVTPDSKSEITSDEVIKCMLRFSASGNKRLGNLAAVFLEDYCCKEQVEQVKSNSIEFIPLPFAEASSTRFDS